MTFQPRMTNSISGFERIGHWTRRTLGGVVADLWDVSCSPLAGGQYVASDPRLFIVLESAGESGRHMALSPHGRRRSPPQAVLRHLSFIPAGMTLDLELNGVRALRHLDLHIDAAALSRRLGSALDPAELEVPRFCRMEPRLLQLADLLAADCAGPAPLHDLYAEGLAHALLAAVLELPRVAPRKAGALAPWQVRRVTAFLEAECQRAIRLDELAALVGLSPSHFSQAFKSATGLPPHRYQLVARIERAKRLLATGRFSLSDVATECGFADQPHFTRVFRQRVGLAPGQWLRQERG